MSTPAPTPGPNDAPDGPARLSEQQVRKIARLARLELSDEQVHDSRVRLSAVLGFMETLRKLESVADNGCAAGETSPPGGNVLRDDTARALPAPEDLERLRALAPARIGPYFAVPRVLGESAS